MSFDIICFDCDSTLSTIEGIDELAERAGIGKEMAALTDAAMNGEVPLEAVYERRLSLIKPNQKDINWLADLYLETRVDGVQEVFKTLLNNNKQVHIISGGIRQAILPLAEMLGLSEHHVHAVDVFFTEDGSYQSYNFDSPLARAGGKAVVCQSLNKGNNSMAMIGDGQTDLESQQAGACFIGFGGVVVRNNVRDHADHYVNSRSLTSILGLIT